MHSEKKATTMSGLGVLFLGLVLLGVATWMLIAAIDQAQVPILLASLGLMLVSILMLSGLFVVNPNEAVALLLFGAYRGTTRENGLRFANPFYKKIKISLKARNLNGERLNVNDSTGNPIEIAAVVV